MIYTKTVESGDEITIYLGVVGMSLRNAFAGNQDAKYRDGMNEYDINIRLDEFDRKSASDVSGFIFVNSKGQNIRLSQFATITQSTGPSMVERKNRRTSVTLIWLLIKFSRSFLEKANWRNKLRVPS